MQMTSFKPSFEENHRPSARDVASLKKGVKYHFLLHPPLLSTTHTLNTSSITSMSDISSGSAKDIVYGFIEQVYQEMQAAKDADTSPDNVPTSPRLSDSPDPSTTSTGVEIVTEDAPGSTQTVDKGKQVDRSSYTAPILLTVTHDDLRAIRNGTIPIPQTDDLQEAQDDLGAISRAGRW